MYSESILSDKRIASLRVVGSGVTGGIFALEVANYGETDFESYKPQTIIVSRDDLQIIKQLIENLQNDRR